MKEINLENLTIPLGSLQGDIISPNSTVNMYVHNANGHKAFKVVNASWESIPEAASKRPLLFSDSSWPGSGSFGVGLVTNM